MTRRTLDVDVERSMREARAAYSRVAGDKVLSPRYLKIPTSFRDAPEPGDFCYDAGKLKIIAADGSIKTFSPDA